MVAEYRHTYNTISRCGGMMIDVLRRELEPVTAWIHWFKARESVTPRRHTVVHGALTRSVPAYGFFSTIHNHFFYHYFCFREEQEKKGGNGAGC